MLSPAFLQPNQLAVPINCPNCGQLDFAVVEKTLFPTGDGYEFTLVNLPDNFYQRLAKSRPHIETLCRKCEGLLPARVYDGEALLAAASGAC